MFDFTIFKYCKPKRLKLPLQRQNKHQQNVRGFHTQEFLLFKQGKPRTLEELITLKP